MNNGPWKAIFDKYKIYKHSFEKSPFYISAAQIKQATARFRNTNEREVRILCKQDSREDRPDVFKENNLFILPIKNGHYVILKGEGYVDIPRIATSPSDYSSNLDFELDSAKIGNSEMQHLDFAYATSMVRTFMEDTSLVLTIRGRKYTPEFSFYVGKHQITAKSVQTEVDAGYEGREQIVLIEAKNTHTQNVIIRQLFYPFRQWQSCTKKKVKTVFFEKRNNEYLFWQFDFLHIHEYNSIQLTKTAIYTIR